jgi:hypothetical protein
VLWLENQGSSRHRSRRLFIITKQQEQVKRKQGERNTIARKVNSTHDASRSKYSISSVGASAAAGALEEGASSTHFLFLSTPASSASAGGSSVDELVSLSYSLTSSSS